MVDELLNFSSVVAINTTKEELIIGLSDSREFSTDNPTIVKVGNQLINLLDQLPEQFSSIIKRYKQPLTLLLVIFLTLVVLQLVVSVSNAIYEFPLLAPVLRLVGLSYSGWFIYRNLVFVETRKDTLDV